MDYLWKTTKQLKPNTAAGLFKGINTWSVSLVQYTASFKTFIREKLRNINHKALHTRDDVERGKQEKDDCVDTTIHRLEEHIKKNKQRLISEANKKKSKTKIT